MAQTQHRNCLPQLKCTNKFELAKIFELFKMHAVSLTRHAQKIFEQLRKVKIIWEQRWLQKKIKNSSGVNDTACTVLAVSLTPYTKYDTACIDERFERPWQPVKRISIKNIYVPEFSYPTTKKIYKFEGAT
jgi:hypothetical protein